MNEKITSCVLNVLTLLAEKRYSDIEKLTLGIRLSAKDIAAAVAEYGCEIIPPPKNALELLDAIEIANTVPSKWSITTPVWTQEEGRSDLSIELTIIDAEVTPQVEFDNIHVL